MEAAERQDSSAGKSASSSSIFGKKGTRLACAFLLLLLAVVFAKTIFAGGSISRLCVLAEWDSVFDAWRSGRAQPYDPSLVQIFVPDYLYLAKNLSRGILPMWNPNCGLGYPFIGDIQSSVFAPLRAVFNFAPNLRTYNFYLILELVVCALSTFFLARKLLHSGSAGGSPASKKDADQLSNGVKAGEPPALRLKSELTGFENRETLINIAAVFAAVCYTFCPYNLWYLELNLGTSASLFPLTALAFVNAAEKKNYLSAVLAGLASALLIVSGHPECSFFGILLSSALMLLLVLLEDNGTLSRNLLTSCKILVIAALSTVAGSAPALFTFAEYLLNGQSYKYGSTYSTPVTWNGILFALANPGQNGASPYLGIIAAVLLPAAVLSLGNGWRQRYRLAAVILLSALTFVLVSQLGPVQNIFIKAPFTAIITRYALPYLLMLLSAMAAAGLYAISELIASLREVDELRQLNSSSLPPWTQYFVYAVSVLMGGAFIVYSSHHLANDVSFLKLCDFDAMLPPTAFNSAAWRRDFIFALLFFLSILACGYSIRLQSFFAQPSRRHSKERSSSKAGFSSLNVGLLLSCTASILSLISILSVAKLSLPQQTQFFYPQTELLQKLQQDQFRTISTCEYVLRPATNCVYGINFLSVHNPLFPKRFFEFVRACGAETDMFNQKFSNKNLSTLLNLASVKYVLSIDPIEETNRFSLAYKAKNNIHVYENKDAAPRAYLVHDEIRTPNAEQSLQAIQSKDFIPSKTAVIEDNSNSAKLTAGNLNSTTPAYETVSSFDVTNPNHVLIKCNTKSPAWLVLTDIYYPGWNVYVDGRKSKIAHANYAFRAVHLDAGEHAVRFAYEPLSLLVGCCTLALFTFLLACLTIAGLLKREI